MRGTRREDGRRVVAGALAWMLLAAVPAEVAAQGCAMCATALGSPDDPLARGFYWSILLLIAAPYAVVGSIAGWLVYRYRVALRRETRGGVLP
jgi:hypothetical protein